MEKKEKKDYLRELQALIEKEKNHIEDANIRQDNSRYHIEMYKEDSKIINDPSYIPKESFWAFIKWLYVSGAAGVISTLVLWYYRGNINQAILTSLIGTFCLTGTLTTVNVLAIIENYNDRKRNVERTNLYDYEASIKKDTDYITDANNRLKLYQEYQSYLQPILKDNSEVSSELESTIEENLQLIKTLGVLKSHN